MTSRKAHPVRWLPLLLLLANPAQANQPPGQERVLLARRGDTIAALLASARVEPTDSAQALAALRPLFPPQRLRPGQELTLRFAPGAERLQEIEVQPEPGRTITVSRSGAEWVAEEEQVEQRRHWVLAEGTVRGSVIDSMERAGLPPAMALGLIRALSWQLDFQREVQPGDRFRVVFERFRSPDGELLRHGRALHVSFDLSGRHLAFWRHESDNSDEWYDDQGRSLRRAFLSTPLDGAHVTSGFGMRRHPVLGFSRVHHGIDFAAPRGTPVFAAADGRVEQVGRNGGYGLAVRLRHPAGYETLYGHLSAFARGLRRGQQVRQGEVIGRVGSTGLSTGPHLHYEVAQDGQSVNPASLRQDAGTALAGAALGRFRADQAAVRRTIAALQPMDEVAAAD